MFLKNVSTQPIKDAVVTFWRETPTGQYISGTAQGVGLAGTLDPGENVQGWPVGVGDDPGYANDARFGPSICRAPARDEGRVVAEVTTVSLADGTVWHPLTDFYVPAPTASNITIENGGGGCVQYSSPKAVSMSTIAAVFWWTDLAGNVVGEGLDAGPVHASHDPITPMQPLCNDADIAGDTSAKGGSFDAATWTVSAAVTGVRYDDGTLWQAVPSVPGTAQADPASGLRISITTYAGVAPVPLKTDNTLPLYACADVTNVSSKPITHFQIVFTHLAEDGTMLGSDPLDIHAQVATGATLQMNCGTFDGDTSPSIYEYAIAASSGAPMSKVPTILYKGKRSTVNARIAEVDFAGAPSWRAPARP